MNNLFKDYFYLRIFSFILFSRAAFIFSAMKNLKFLLFNGIKPYISILLRIYGLFYLLLLCFIFNLHFRSIYIVFEVCGFFFFMYTRNSPNTSKINLIFIILFIWFYSKHFRKALEILMLNFDIQLKYVLHLKDCSKFNLW